MVRLMSKPMPPAVGQSAMSMELRGTVASIADGVQNFRSAKTNGNPQIPQLSFQTQCSFGFAGRRRAQQADREKQTTHAIRHPFVMEH